MDKLKEYEAMLIEKADIERRVKDLEQQLAEYTNDTRVQDSVSGGFGGTQHFTIQGFPYREYTRKKSLLMERKIRMENLNRKLEESISDVEEYINNIDSSTIRCILRYKYIDNLTWKAVARKMGGGYTEESIRKKCDRYLKSNGR